MTEPTTDLVPLLCRVLIHLRIRRAEIKARINLSQLTGDIREYFNLFDAEEEMSYLIRHIRTREDVQRAANQTGVTHYLGTFANGMQQFGTSAVALEQLGCELVETITPKVK